MRKIGFLALIFIAGCGSPAEIIQQDKKQGKKESIFTQKEIVITQDNLEDYLLGTWEAEDLGVILDQYGYSLPAKITFEKNQQYTWEYMNNGIKVISSGKYKIVQKKTTPYRISFFQEKEVNAALVPIGKKQVKEMNGIFEFTKTKKFKTVFYDKDFIPKIDEFQELDIQIYRKFK